VAQLTIGWKLDRQQRAALLARYPARYENVVADHVTLSVAGSEQPEPLSNAEIIGYVDDENGIEAMIVAIDGSTVRPDGKIWHITWSTASGRTARESNDVIAKIGWLQMRVERLALIPAIW